MVLHDIPLVGSLRFNPLVSLCSSLVIWGMTMACALSHGAFYLPFTKIIVAINSGFSWLFVLGHNMWAFFLVYVYFRFVGRDRSNRS